jgi:hypothetical protein
VRFLYLVLIACLCGINVNAQDVNESTGKKEGIKNTYPRADKMFPFSLDEADQEAGLSINLADPAVVSRLSPAFKKNNISFDADMLQEVLMQILQKKAAYLANTTSFIADDKVLFVKAGNPVYQEKLLAELCPILKSAAQLEGYLKNFARQDADQ